MNDLVIHNRPDFLPALSEDSHITNEFLGGLGGGGGLDMPVLSVRGKVFRLRRDGQEVSLKTNVLDVILVGARAATSRRIFLDQYQSGEVKAPACSSEDGIKPDHNAREPQSDTCATCPRNVWTKGPSGGMRKECDDYKRVLVFIPEKNIYSPVVLDVSATSMRKKKGEAGPDLQMREYVQALARNKFEPHQVVTTLGFTDDEYPRLRFSYARLITREEYGDVMACRESDAFEAALAHKEEEGPIVQEDKPAPAPRPKPVAVPDPEPEIEDEEDEEEAPAPAPKPAPKKRKPAPVVDAEVVEDEEVEEEAPKPAPKKRKPAPAEATSGDLDDILSLLQG